MGMPGKLPTGVYRTSLIFQSRFQVGTAILLIYHNILLDFSLTVKAATLIFISGCGSAIYLLRKGNQVLFIINKS